MTHDFTNKSDREELHGIVKRTIEGHRNNIKLELTVNSLKCIERLIETQERIIEDQEERIAIMTEGKLTLDDFHDFLWNKYFGLKICEENMAFLNKWILAYKEHVKAEHGRKKDGEAE